MISEAPGEAISDIGSKIWLETRGTGRDQRKPIYNHAEHLQDLSSKYGSLVRDFMQVSKSLTESSIY